MSRTLLACLLAGAVLGAPALHAGTRVKVVHRGHTTKVVVHHGFPIRRTLPRVFLVPPRVAIRVAPVRYLAPVVWVPVVVVAPAAHELAWEDAQELAAASGWTDFTLTANQTGRKLFVEVAHGTVSLNFAEVVFENGDTQVVDFGEHPRGPGLYSLLDFADGRKVDHVRMVARSDSEAARVVLRMSR